MQFEAVAGITAVIAIIIFYIAYRMLASSGWVMGWIQGNLGLVLLLLAGLLALAVMDIRTYRPMFNDVPIGTFSLHTLSPGSYKFRLVDSKGVERSYNFSGDQYYLLANQLRWSTRFAGMGMGHGYRIQNLAIDLPAEDVKIPLLGSGYVDVWSLFRRYVPGGFVVSAEAVHTLPRRVVDGAMYELVPDGSEILIVPVNQVAKQAESLVPPVLPEVQVMPEMAQPPAVAAPLAAAPVPELVMPAPVVIPETPKSVPVAVPAKTDAPSNQGNIIRSPQVQAPEIPGAHLQATPATVIEKPTPTQGGAKP